jgi:hypothetical protein
MERMQDWSLEPALHLNAVCVHCDIEQSARETEHEQAAGERRQPVGERREDQCGGQEGNAGAQHRAAPKAIDRDVGSAGAGEEPRSHPEQREAKFCVADAGLVLESRNAWSPRAGDGGVHHERQRDADPRASEVLVRGHSPYGRQYPFT